MGKIYKLWGAKLKQSIEASLSFYVDLAHQKILYSEILLYGLHGGFNEAKCDVASEYVVIAYV